MSLCSWGQNCNDFAAYRNTTDAGASVRGGQKCNIAFQYSCTAQMCAPGKVQFYLQYQEANGGALLLLAGRLKRKGGREGIGGGVRLAVVTSAPPLVVTLLGRSGRHG